jgi:hypothetical protein
LDLKNGARIFRSRLHLGSYCVPPDDLLKSQNGWETNNLRSFSPHFVNIDPGASGV